MDKSFKDYWDGAANWITLTSSAYYPDYLEDACEMYGSVLRVFKEILDVSESSSALFKNICKISETWMRIQLCRVFNMSHQTRQ